MPIAVATNSTGPAAAYYAVCRHLRASPHPRFAAALTSLPVRPSHFSARAVETDAHAVALCSALLLSHGAAWRSVIRYVCAYTEQRVASIELTNATLLSVSPSARSRSNHSSGGHGHIHHVSSSLTTTTDASKDNRNNSVVVGSNRIRTCVFVDFSHSLGLTERGAAAILAACLLLPSRARVELDLRRCMRVASLDLRPWHALLDITGIPSHSSAVFTGLALDGCPLRAIPSHTLRRLPQLRWISLRGTRVRNFWRAGDIIHALPSLVAALFAGDVSQADDLSRAQMIARGDTNSSGGIGGSGVRGPVNGSRRVTWINDGDNVDVSGGGGGGGGGGDVEEDEEGDDRDKWPAQEIYPPVSHATASPLTHTPATLLSHFREFVLASRPPSLRWLDGVPVTSRECTVARNIVATRFEHVQQHHCEPRTSRLLALLRDRELGRGPRTAGVWSSSFALRGDRPKKRKRSMPEYSSRPPDLEAMVAATRLPSTQGGGNLAPSHQMAVVLAAVAAQARDARLAQIMPHHVEDTGSRTIPGSSSAQVPATGPPPGTANQVPVQVDSNSHRGLANRHMRRPLIYAAANPFRHGIFERCVDVALVHRRGCPRIAYWKQGNDRPRQFEYNPAKPSQVVYATANGFLVVVDEESGVVKASCRAGGGAGIRPCGNKIQRTYDLKEVVDYGMDTAEPAEHRTTAVFGLSWLNKQSDVFISGKYGGDIYVYNVDWMQSGRKGGCMYACEGFEQLTSISVSADDARFAVSGWSHDVGIFDLASGRRVETMRGCHAGVINVIKFAHHNPFVLLTSSFDGCVRKWDLRERRPDGKRRAIFTTRSRTDNMMACFSSDDERLLVSAVDNEVKQYSAVDGRLMLEFDIRPTGNRYNFTRSYYMNERDYIVSGSCMESVVRVYNARSGGLLTEVDVDDRHVSMDRQLCVQSLRANPCRPYNFCALLVSKDDSVDEVIAQVDLRSRW